MREKRSAQTYMIREQALDCIVYTGEWAVGIRPTDSFGVVLGDLRNMRPFNVRTGGLVW